jgi:endonuclease-3
LVIATILSAQCTDGRVNQVTPHLFRRYKTAADFAGAQPLELEKIIHSTGFYRAKARHIIGCATGIVTRFGGEVPKTLEELTTLPGVGRKTANVVLGMAFGMPGLVVDTHVRRVSRRLGWTKSNHPDQIEADLCLLIPRAKWTTGSHRILLHGRHVCVARKPRCATCQLADLCPSAVVVGWGEGVDTLVLARLPILW